MTTVDEMLAQAKAEREKAEYHLQRAVLFEEIAQRLTKVENGEPARPPVSPRAVAVGAGVGRDNPFSQYLAARGHTIGSYARRLKEQGVWEGSLSAVQRWHNTTGQGRRCMRKIAEWIHRDIGYPTDAAHWPNGFIGE